MSQSAIEGAEFGRSFWRSRSEAPGLSAEVSIADFEDPTFRLFADNIPTLCWIAGGDGYIVWYNRRWHAYCGTTPEQMEGWGWQSVHDPLMLPSVIERWVAAIRSGEPFEMTFPLRGADGNFRPFLTRIQPVHDSAGKVVRWFGVNTEVSDQVEAEEALRVERDRSRGVIENMAEGFVLLDHDFRVVDINAEGMRFESRPRESIIGRIHWEVWPGSESTEFGQLYKRAMAERTRVSLEHHYVWADGRSAWMDMRAFPSGEGLAIFYRDVTERKTSEARVAHSEEHYRHAVELNPQVVWTATPDGQLDRVGQRWTDWTGTSGLGSSWGDAMHPDDLKRSVEAWVASCNSGQAYDIEHRARMRDGQYRWMHSRAYPRRDGSGAIVQWYGTTEDVQDQKNAQTDLAASEARFRTVAETMPGFVWTATESGDLDYTSPNWHVYSGADPTASNGQGWGRFVHPDDQAQAFDKWRLAVASSQPYEVEFRLRRSDGAYRWWLARARPITGSTYIGSTRWIGTCSDVDDIIAAREALGRSREQLEQLVDERTRERDRIWRLIPDLLMNASLDGRLLSVNPAWTHALGYDEKFLLDSPIWQLVHPEDVPISNQAVKEMQAGRTSRHQSRVLAANGSYRWFDWISTPMDDTFYAVARDISDSKQREAELVQAQEALRQSQKMEAVGQLTGGIAHDFNNMLAVVTTSLTMLRRRLRGDDARATRYLEMACEGASRAAVLTQRLLAFARQQPLRPESVDINRLVAGMSDLLRHSLGSDVRLETVLGGGLWPTHVDPNQLENVILNLGVNARDAMPDGGRLTIETQNSHLDDRYVTAHAGVAAGQYVLIAVTDTGTGMPPDVAAKAFDPFFTTKEVGKGTGLGLSQVYGFVKQSGGHVKIYSEVGLGTTMKIYLPRLLDAIQELKVDPKGDDLPLSEQSELVLVVEDEPVVRQLSVEILNELGYRTLEADGAAAAMRLLRLHPEIALMFTDIVMPDVNGVKLAEEARSLWPSLKVLFVTGYAPNAIVHNGVFDTSVEMIGKPFSVEDLATKVRYMLDRQS